MEYSCIVVAAGNGERTGLKYNKVLHKMNNSTIIENSLEPFVKDDSCKQIILVINEKEQEDFDNLNLNSKIEYAYGGKERKDSVYQGLNNVKYEYVMIHDGARPYLKKEQVEKIKQSLQTYDATLLMVPAIDTAKIVIDGIVKETIDRTTLYNAQTPQAFKTSLIKECYEKLNSDNKSATDDIQVVEMYSNTTIKVIEGEYSNIKITTKSDVKSSL